MKNFIIIGAISMALFSCHNQSQKQKKHWTRFHWMPLSKTTRLRVSFNVHLQENVLTFYNGVQESFEVASVEKIPFAVLSQCSLLTFGSLPQTDGYQGDYYPHRCKQLSVCHLSPRARTA
jgi:hypothetical protein